MKITYSVKHNRSSSAILQYTENIKKRMNTLLTLLTDLDLVIV